MIYWKKLEKKLSLKDLARELNGSLEPEDSGGRIVTGFSTLEAAKKNDVSFVSGEKFLQAANHSGAGALVVPEGIRPEGAPLIVVDSVWKSAGMLLGIFFEKSLPSPGTDESAQVDEEAVIGQNVHIGKNAVIEKKAEIGDRAIIGPGCYIGPDVKIGADCVIYPNVSILYRTIIGDRVILHPGVVIGADGFKYDLSQGYPQKIPQVGRVVIEDDAEIGANSCIDRASLTETRIGKGVKIDNQVQIGHNVVVGENTVMAAQTAIGGSTVIGPNCLFGGQAGARDNITIAEGSMIAGGAGVTRTISEKGEYFGYPAMNAREFFKKEAYVRRLSKTIAKLEKRLEKLENRSDS